MCIRDRDTTVSIDLTGTDVDGTVASFALANLPANGTLYTDAALTNVAVTGTDYVATGETLTLYFSPDADWNGMTTFQYSAKDDLGLVDTTPATGTITITPVNDDPVATDDDFATTEGGTCTIDAVNELLNNDCLLYTSPSPRDATLSRMPSSA